jgi:hypothetical protein
MGLFFKLACLVDDVDHRISISYINAYKFRDVNIHVGSSGSASLEFVHLYNYLG